MKKRSIETNTLTCVYKINDKENFDDELSRIMDNFKDPDNQPWSVIAISRGHEMQRLSLIEQAHDAGRHDLLDDIFGLVDPSKIDDINQLDAFHGYTNNESKTTWEDLIFSNDYDLLKQASALAEGANRIELSNAFKNLMVISEFMTSARQNND